MRIICQTWYRFTDILCRVNLTPDGREALLKLSKGDMRRVLNVLQVCIIPVFRLQPTDASFAQACHSAYPTVDEAAVYNCTGSPHPSDIEDMVKSMMKEEFETSYRSKWSALPLKWQLIAIFNRGFDNEG